MTVKRTETSASWFAVLIAAILVVLMAFASGCGGMSRLQTAHAVQTETDVYIVNQEAIAATCPTQHECVAEHGAERERFRAARAAICRAGKGCR